MLGAQRPKLVHRKTGRPVSEKLPLLNSVGTSALGMGGDSVTRGVTRLVTISYCENAFKDKKNAQSTIRDFVKKYGVDLSESEKPPSAYATLNDFFQRRLRPGIRPLTRLPVAMPADCRCTVFDSVQEAQRLWIKGDEFTVADLLSVGSQSKVPKDVRHSPAVAVFRLAPADYHRFHFPLDCSFRKVKTTGKSFASVAPATVNSSGDNPFTRNKRMVVHLNTEEFGKVVFVIIGATCVGSVEITASPGKNKKGDEMGMFGFGGSTCVMLANSRKIQWSPDLLRNSAAGKETLCRWGQRLGKKAEAA